jgi:hypothetical protein
VAAAPTGPAVLREGQAVTVAYDAMNPERMVLAQDPPGTSFSFLAAVAALLAVMTLGTMFFTARMWLGASGHGFDLPWVDVPGVVLPSNRTGGR